jgi:hypothetical protein
MIYLEKGDSPTSFDLGPVSIIGFDHHWAQLLDWGQDLGEKHADWRVNLGVLGIWAKIS